MEIPPELIKLAAKDPKFANLVAKCGFVTGLGPGYIIPGPWPELTPLAL